MNSGTWECKQMPNFSGNEDLCKLGKEYLNDLLCKFVIYSLQHSETFDVSHVFLPLTVTELSTLKQVRFFCPLCIYTVSQKSIPDIFNCNLKMNDQILIIFATNISGTTCHQTIVQFPTSPNVCSCTT